MSAEVLRRAASLMRERATYAKPGPWSYLSSGGTKSGGEEVTFASEDLESSLTVECGPDGGAMFDCLHFASWHPAVALPVADLLDEIAKTFGKPGHRDWHGPESCATAVARAYLGSES